MAEDKEKIKAMVILQIMGRPKEYLVSTLRAYIKQMGEENGIAVKNSDVKEPRKMEQKVATTDDAPQTQNVQNEFYNTFAEIEVEADSLMQFMTLIFKYMPAHVEIISPENISIANNGWNEIFNELVRRLHAFDEVVRVTQVEKEILQKQLKTLIGQREKPKNSKEKEEKKK